MFLRKRIITGEEMLSLFLPWGHMGPRAKRDPSCAAAVWMQNVCRRRAENRRMGYTQGNSDETSLKVQQKTTLVRPEHRLQHIILAHAWYWGKQYWSTVEEDGHLKVVIGRNGRSYQEIMGSDEIWRSGEVLVCLVSCNVLPAAGVFWLV